jgi:hypothetical protein
MIAARRRTDLPEIDRGHLPPDVILIADHLDAALAFGEDMLATALSPALAGGVRTRAAIDRSHRELASFVRAVRTNELALAARVLRARRIADDLLSSARQFAPLVRLFHAGTAAIADADEVHDPAAGAATFETGDAALAYLTSRRIVAPDAVGFGALGQLAVGEDCHLLGRIRLGDLMTLLATFLDTLDRTYDLYPSSKASGLAAQADEPSDDAKSAPLELAPDLAAVEN